MKWMNRMNEECLERAMCKRFELNRQWHNAQTSNRIKSQVECERERNGEWVCAMFVIAIGQSFMRCPLHSRRRHETPNEIFWKCNGKRQLVLICFWINCMRLGDFVQCTMENGVIHVIVLNVTSCVRCSCFAKRLAFARRARRYSMAFFTFRNAVNLDQWPIEFWS